MFCKFDCLTLLLSVGMSINQCSLQISMTQPLRHKCQIHSALIQVHGTAVSEQMRMNIVRYLRAESLCFMPIPPHKSPYIVVTHLMVFPIVDCIEDIFLRIRIFVGMEFLQIFFVMTDRSCRKRNLSVLFAFAEQKHRCRRFCLHITYTSMKHFSYSCAGIIQKDHEKYI